MKNLSKKDIGIRDEIIKRFKFTPSLNSLELNTALHVVISINDREIMQNSQPYGFVDLLKSKLIAAKAILDDKVKEDLEFLESLK